MAKALATSRDRLRSAQANNKFGGRVSPWSSTARPADNTRKVEETTMPVHGSKVFEAGAGNVWHAIVGFVTFEGRFGTYTASDINPTARVIKYRVNGGLV